MAQRGRKAKPAELRKRQNNPSRRRLVEAPVEVLPSLSPEPPSSLCEIGRDVWRALVPSLGALNVVRATDHNTLYRYCDLTALWIKVRRSLGRKDPASYKSGSLRKSDPRLASLLSLDARLVTYEDRLGLNPSARTQLLARLANVPAPPKPPGLPSDKPGARSDIDDQPPVSPLGALAPPPGRTTH